MINRLEEFKKKLELNTKSLEEIDASSNINEYKKLMIERSRIEPIVESLSELEKLEKDKEEVFELSCDSNSDISSIAKEELSVLDKKIEELNRKCTILLLPSNPLDNKNTIMEIRAGTGGEEAALFAADLFRMYCRYAENKKWKVEILNINETLLHGIKEVVFSLQGTGVYSLMRNEGGTHRVQRIPETESSGRIHTSAVTVAVLPEAEETDVVIKNEDLRIDVMRAGGHGGQCVNTTDSAVRITHLPTGLVVIQQDEKSQLKNKNKALRVLRSRLLDLEEKKKHSEIDEERRKMVGSGDRSERIRTYNFPQNRVTDHRINLTLYHLDSFIEGNMDEIIEALKIDEARRLLLESD